MISFSLQIFPYSDAFFEPTSVELHQTGTFPMIYHLGYSASAKSPQHKTVHNWQRRLFEHTIFEFFCSRLDFEIKLILV